MRTSLVVIMVFFFSAIPASAAEQQPRCRPETAEDSKLFSSDFHWDMPFKKMMNLSSTIYTSGKRLPKRAYYDQAAGEFKMPLDRGGTETPVSLPKDLADIVRNHIEKALARKYADAIFFPDLGHSHYLIPLEKYEREYAPIPVNEIAALYEKLFRDPEVKAVYHTAEQLDTAPAEADSLHTPHLRWRYYTRNLIGENRPGGEVYVVSAVDHRSNTLSDVPGYRWWGGGLNVSASVDGCFPYNHNGQIRYFDLSLYDLASESNQGTLFFNPQRAGYGH